MSQQSGFQNGGFQNGGRSSDRSMPRSRSVWMVTAMCLFSVTWMVIAQQPAGGESPQTDAPKPVTSLDELSVKQGQIADKYARLEQLLIRMSELEAINNPQRAALLKRAAQQSSNKLTRQQLSTLVKLLSPPAQLKRAVDEQQQIIGDLKALLELLQSENRADRLKSEQTRIKDYIKEVDRLIRLQQGVQGRTEGGDDSRKLATDQEQIANRTDQLAKRLQETEEGSKSNKESDESSDKSKDGENASDKNGSEKGKQESGKGSDKKAGQDKDGKATDSKDKNEDAGKKDEAGDKSKSSPGEDGKDKSAAKDSPEKGDSEKGDSEKGDSEKGDSDKKAGEKSAEGQKSPGSEKSKGSPSKGSPKKSGSPPKQSPPGEPSESPESDQQSEPSQAPPPEEESNPARKRLQAAEERMREAQRKLSEAKNKDATTEQEKAREELEKAKAELEQILRQMREEEIERTLALLEGRFRRMLESQLRIYESTKRLDKIPAPQRNRDIDIQASKLGFEEGKLAVDADKALLLLREEGSSVAFPETVELVRDDMQHVSELLANSQIDGVTQSIEEEIIQSLEELVAALQKAQQDLKDKKPPPPNQAQKPMDPSDRPLVDQLAELKMIRSLQLRVNTRTQRYSRLLEDVDDPVGRANDADLHQSLVKLAELEKRVHEITRNLVLGKNE